METFSALLAICAGNSPVTGEFPARRPVTRSFDVSLICVRINGWVSNGTAGDLRRPRAHYDVTVMWCRDISARSSQTSLVRITCPMLSNSAIYIKPIPHRSVTPIHAELSLMKHYPLTIHCEVTCILRNKLSNLFLVQDSGDTTSDNLKNISLDEHIQIVSGFLMDDILLT